MRPQPLNFTGCREPLINLSFAFEAANVLNFCSRTVSLDLPVAVRDALVFEDNPRRFAHILFYDIFRDRSKERDHRVELTKRIGASYLGDVQVARLFCAISPDDVQCLSCLP
jgi:hypothetical protein